MNRAFVLLLSLALFSCKKSDLVKHIDYTGPLREIEKMETFYSENDKIQVKVLADIVYEYKDGDREFPKGIYLEFYDAFGKIESTLRANEAHFFKEENKWRGRGKVEIKNLKKKEQLNTEELFWKPTDKKIFTDSFVTIRMESDIIYGMGLDAKQDMSDYTIRHPTGDFEVEE
jgi:LPS export ABC transporter protein LptC